MPRLRKSLPINYVAPNKDRRLLLHNRNPYLIYQIICLPILYCRYLQFVVTYFML